MDGAHYERELVHNFDLWNGSAIRIPASGAATKAELPDVFGYYNGNSFAMECKATSNKYSSFTVRETRDLIHFAHGWNSIPVLVSRFSQDTDFYGFVCLTEDDIPVENDDVKSFSFKKPERHELDTMEEIINDPPEVGVADLYDNPPKDRGTV